MEVGKGGGERRAWRRTHFIISIIIIMIISIMIIIISIIMVIITVTILVRTCTGRLPWAKGFLLLPPIHVCNNHVDVRPARL